MKKTLTLALALVFLLSLTACSFFEKVGEAFDALPVLKEGERYFEGEADFEYAESCTVSFVYTEDGSVHSTKITMVNVSFEVPYEGRTIRYSASQSSFSGGKGEVDSNGYVEIETRQIVFRITIDGDSAHGEVDYTHMSRRNEKAANRFSVLVGTFPFVAEDRTDSIV